MAMKPTPADPTVPTTAVAAAPAFSLKPSKQTAVILGAMIGVLLATSVGWSVWQNGIKEQQAALIRTKTQQVNDSQLVANQLDATEAEFQLVQSRIGRLETLAAGRRSLWKRLSAKTTMFLLS